MPGQNDEPVKDPVCGMIKPKSMMKAQSVYKGKTYYFCAESDKQMFDGYPEGWVPQEDRRPS